MLKCSTKQFLLKGEGQTQEPHYFGGLRERV